MPDRICARCGEPFVPTRPNRKFCSTACTVANNREETKAKRKGAQPISLTTCAGCERSYTPDRPWQRWCSRACGDRWRQRLYRELNSPPSITRPCRYCDAMFTSPDGRQYYCGDECSRTAKSLREAYRRYGITMEDYRSAHFDQDGKCAICGKPERTERNTLLAVDHDHTTGRFRGLLCSQCNRALGLLGDDPKVILAAAAYVEQHRQLV